MPLAADDELGTWGLVRRLLRSSGREKAWRCVEGWPGRLPEEYGEREGERDGGSGEGVGGTDGEMEGGRDGYGGRETWIW